MAGNHNIIQRNAIIFDMVSSGSIPSKADIATRLESHGFDVCSRTIDRSIESFRKEHNIELKYNRESRGYEFNDQYAYHIKALENFFSLSQETELALKCIHSPQKMEPYFDFDSTEEFQSSPWMSSIILALTEHRLLHIKHQSFTHTQPTSYTFEPYLLKKFNGRMYLHGHAFKVDKPGSTKKTINLALDRILQLDVDDDMFDFDKSYDAKELFSNTYGVTYSNYKPCLIVLQYPHSQAKYILSQPLHSSQKVIFEDKLVCHIQVLLRPNFELKQRILQDGPRVKVLSPASFAKEVKKDLRAAVEQY